MKKLALWILLGVFSTALAEVSISSQPLVFFNSYGLLFVFPLYTTHILFLAPLAMGKNQPVRFSGLIFAGCLFGMYEAYITKVLWNPPWNEHTLTILNISVFTFLVLVFFFHTWMSFIFPLLLAEYLLFSDRRIFNSLPVKLQNLLKKPFIFVVLFLFFGLANGVGEKNIPETVISVLGTSLIMLLLVLFARKQFLKTQDSLVDYLPRGKALLVIGILLAGVYANHLFNTRPEALPNFSGHGMIWLFYILFAVLLTLSRNRISAEPVEKSYPIPKIRYTWILYSGLYLMAAILAVSFLKSLQPLIVIILWGVGIPFGLMMFGVAFHRLSPRKGQLSTDFPRE